MTVFANQVAVQIGEICTSWSRTTRTPCGWRLSTTIRTTSVASWSRGGNRRTTILSAGPPAPRGRRRGRRTQSGRRTSRPALDQTLARRGSPCRLCLHGSGRQKTDAVDAGRELPAPASDGGGSSPWRRSRSRDLGVLCVRQVRAFPKTSGARVLCAYPRLKAVGECVGSASKRIKPEVVLDLVPQVLAEVRIGPMRQWYSSGGKSSDSS